MIHSDSAGAADALTGTHRGIFECLGCYLVSGLVAVEVFLRIVPCVNHAPSVKKI